jgi:hypothetical protein
VKQHQELMALKVADASGRGEQCGNDAQQILPDTVGIKMFVCSCYLRDNVIEADAKQTDPSSGTTRDSLRNNGKLRWAEDHRVPNHVGVAQTLALDHLRGRLANRHKDEPEDLRMIGQVGCLHEDEQRLDLPLADEREEEQSFKL